MSRQVKPIKENLRLAKIVLIACIAFSIVVIGPMKLSGVRKDAMDVFRNGTEKGIVVSVYTDLVAAAESANRLSNIASSYLGENHSDVRRLKESAEKILSTSDADKMLSAFSGMSLAAENVTSALDGKLTEKEEREVRSLFANIDSYSSTIKRDKYFTLANDFNGKRSAFPAVIFAGLFGIDTLPVGGK